MTTRERAQRAPLVAEVGFAFIAGATAFWLAAVVLAEFDSDVVAAVLGVGYLIAVIAVARSLGVAYAVPIAMAGILAYDWFYLPPTHALEVPDTANMLDLLVVLGVGVLIGQLAADAVRRAERSESARAKIAAEQAALRRVATLVARGVPPDDIFAAVAREVAQVLGVQATHMARYDSDGKATGVGSWSPGGIHVRVGARVDLDETSVMGQVLKRGRPARIERYDDASGEVTAMTHALNIRSSVGAPILVDGQLWGVIVVSSDHEQPLPDDTEARLLEFTELVATAIANTEARTEANRLTDEQAALRRVATLVAQGVRPNDLFAAVAQEIGGLLGADLAGMARYESDATSTVVAAWAAEGEPAEVGRWPLDGAGLATTIWRTGQPARIENCEGGIRSSVGSPIVVEGRVWGALFVHSKQADPPPSDTESRLMNFSQLVATGMSNAHARTEVQRLADEQAALRRVATLVARGSPAADVFTAVAEEVGQLLRIKDTALLRYEADGTATVVVNRIEGAVRTPVGTRMSLDGNNVATQVLRTKRSVRQDDYDAETSDSLGGYVNSLGFHSGIGSPIVVEGRLWGVMVAVSRRADSLPAEAEARMEEFTELIGTAISNIQARSDLGSSRARIVAAADDERRRVVRDLHDGAQQRLVHTIVTLKLAQRAARTDGGFPASLVTEALTEAERATAELRELAHGMLPSVLTRGGLRAGLDALAARMALPVDISVSTNRLPAAIEATAYFVVAEALTNVAKHSQAAHAEVDVRLENGSLRLQVRDDGVGGAQPDGSGLVGLADRLAVVHGRLHVESPRDGGTLLEASIPVSDQFAELRR